MKHVHAFVSGHVLTAFVTGAMAGAFFDLKAVMVFTGVLSVSAIVSVSVLVCGR